MHCLAKGVRVVCETMMALLTLESRMRSAMFLIVLTPTLPSSAKKTNIWCVSRASEHVLPDAVRRAVSGCALV